MGASLGISGLYHDAAAALVVDGVLVAAIQEERLSRRKNDPELPRHAMAACLRLGGLRAGDLERVVFYENPYRKLERVLTWTMSAYPKTAASFPRVMAGQLGGKLWVVDRLAELLGVPRKRVQLSSHHLSHAASAFFVSPFGEAAILTIDGVGEDTTTGIFRGQDRHIDHLLSLPYPHSLGLLYAALTAYLGFEVNEGEQKVMGLAAFGAPRLEAELAQLIQLHSDGSFELSPRYFALEGGDELGFTPALERLLGPRRRPGTPWSLEDSAEDRRYADLAATLQHVVEEALLGLARRARRETGLDALCLAGGVALNAVANARLAKHAGFSRIFVQPAAGDAGGALGAALLGALELGDPRPAPLEHVALGEAISVDDACALAEHLGLRWERLGDPHRRVAELLANGQLVGLCSGRFEWGPRALGQRSLLALPGEAAMRERLNRMVKRREPFRPFAPAVVEARAPELFGDAPRELTRFMTGVCHVRPERRDALVGVTHVDGSARLQTVTDASPALLSVLTELGQLTAMPVALNTSLNGAAEPIVASAGDALAFLSAHEIDGLLVEDCLFRRPA